MDKKDSPCGHDHIVYTVFHGDSWCNTIIWSEDLRYKSAINEITANENGKTHKETDHETPPGYILVQLLTGGNPKCRRLCSISLRWKLSTKLLQYEKNVSRKKKSTTGTLPRCGLIKGRLYQRISSLPVVMSFPLFRSKIIILSDSTDKLTVEPILKLRSPKTTPVRRKSPTLTLIVDSIPVGMAP